MTFAKNLCQTSDFTTLRILSHLGSLQQQQGQQQQQQQQLQQPVEVDMTENFMFSASSDDKILVAGDIDIVHQLVNTHTVCVWCCNAMRYST